LIPQRGQWVTFSREYINASPNIAWHLGHVIPMCINRMPTTNIPIAPKERGLKNVGGKYFSENANMVKMVKPTATKVKYNLVRLLMISLGLVISSVSRSV
jgi:hypothetical protein